MAEAHARAAWDHTSQVLCLLANCHRDPKRQRQPFKPQQFHPYHQRRRRAVPVSAERLADDIMRVGESRRRKGAT